jgi:hypothetical protein
LVPGKLAFRPRPISLRSPPPVFFMGTGCGSTFRVRYVSVSFLFLKPLGTFYIMRQDREIVKRISEWIVSFPQLTEGSFSCR